MGRCGRLLTSRSNEAQTSDPSYENLIRKALRLVRGQERSTARERALAEVIASTEMALDEKLRQASIGAAGDDVPRPISLVMRAPKGVDRLAVVYHDGMVIKAMLHPLGKHSPEREAAVWRCLRDNALRVREQRP